ncbi:MAG: hypothetical protein EAZ34_00440 [Polaromonas sp.]|nr:MAG: hypothetical protein EAZ34_00440 [Polaromonas sp.]
MRAIFGVLSVLLVLAVVALLVKKQLSPSQHARPASVSVGTESAPSPAGPPQVPPPQHIQQQYKQALDAAMQQARPVPDDK